MSDLFTKMQKLHDAAIAKIFAANAVDSRSAVLAGETLAALFAAEIEFAFAALSDLGESSMRSMLDDFDLAEKRRTAEEEREFRIIQARRKKRQFSEDRTISHSLERVTQRSVKQAQAWVAANLKSLFGQRQPMIDRLVHETTKGYVRVGVLDALIDGTRAQARTLANTALGGVQRLAQHGVAQEITDGPEALFLYIGPEDQKTRPYCAALADKVVSLSALRSTPNAQGLPPHVFLGGYNCRHALIPVSGLQVKEQRLTLAVSSDYQRAAQGARR